MDRCKSFRVGKIRLKLLLIIAAVTVVVGCSVFALHRLQQRRLRVALREEALQQLDAGEEQAALGTFLRYVRLNPEDFEARLQTDELFSKLAEAPEDLRASVFFSEAILREQPELDEVRTRQVSKLMRIGRNADALDHLEWLLKSHSKAPSLLALKAVCLEQQAFYRDAETAYQQAIDASPQWDGVQLGARTLTRADLVRNLANLYVDEFRDWESAQALVDRVQEQSPDSLELSVVKAGLLAKAGDRQEAAEELEKTFARYDAQQRLPHADAVVLNLTLLDAVPQLGADQAERLRDICAGLAEQGCTDFRLYQYWAQFEQRQGNRAAAIAALEKGTEVLPEHKLLTAFLVEELISAEAIERAEKVLSESQELELGEGTVHYLQGRLAMSKGNWTEARDLFLQVRTEAGAPDLVRSRSAFYLSTCYGQLGDRVEQHNSLNLVADEDAQLPQVQLARARSLRSLGRLAEASQMYQLLPATSVPVTELMETELELMLQTPPVRRDWPSFDRALESALENHSEEAGPLTFLRARSLAARDPALAETLFKSLTDQSPETLDVWVARIENLVRQDEFEAATETLQQATKVHGTHARLLATQIPIWEQGDPAQVASRLRELEQQFDTADPVDAHACMQQLMDAYKRLGQKQDAMRLSKRMAFQQGASVESKLRYFVDALVAQDMPAATAARDLLEDLGEQAAVAHEFATILLETWGETTNAEAVQAAIARLAQLARKETRAPVYSLARALLCERVGRLRDAAQAYSEAIQRGVRDPATIGRLMHLLASQGRKEELEVLRRTMQVDAIATENPLLEASRYAASGQTKRADELFRQCLKEAPEQLETWVVYLQFLKSQDRLAEVKKLAARADEFIKDPVSLGIVAETAGDLQSAEQLYQDAYQAEHETETGLQLARVYVLTSQADAALKLLSELSADKDSGNPEARQRTKRLMAAALATRSFADLPKAIALLKQNLDEVLDPSEDLRQLARIQALYLTPQNADQIISVLEELRTQQPLLPDDLMLLAEAFDMAGQPSDATATWHSMVVADSVQPSHLRQYIERQLGQHDALSVAAALDRLRSMNDAGPELRELECRYYCLDNQSEKVLPLLKQYLSHRGSESNGSNESQTLVVANILRKLLREFPELSSQTQETFSSYAEQLYRQAMQTSPSAVLGLSLLLADQNRGSDAFAALTTTNATVEQTQLLAAALNVMETTELPSTETSKIAAWAQSVFESVPTVDAAMLFEHFLRISGKEQEAINLNRQLLQATPNNVTVLNNQSSLLSLHGSADEAMQLATRAINIAGPLPFLLDTRAMAKLAKGDTSGAIDDFSAALAQDDSSIIRFHLASAYLRAENKEAAKSHAEKIVSDVSRLRRILPRHEQAEIDRVMRILKAR